MERHIRVFLDDPVQIVSGVMKIICQFPARDVSVTFFEQVLDSGKEQIVCVQIQRDRPAVITGSVTEHGQKAAQKTFDLVSGAKIRGKEGVDQLLTEGAQEST